MSNQNLDQTEAAQFDISESNYKTSHTAVRKARRFALQGLYEWLMTDHRFEQTGLGEWKANAPHDIAARTRASNAMHTVHLGYYHEMMREIPLQIESLESLISKHLDRDISKIDMVEHAVLLIGAYELKSSQHIPYKVILDESMKLNTHFGATDAHKLINAVMDRLAADIRELEVKSDVGYKENRSNKIANDTQVNVSAVIDKDSALSSDNEDNNAAEVDNTALNDAKRSEDIVPTAPKPRIGRKTNSQASVSRSAKSKAVVPPALNQSSQTQQPTSVAQESTAAVQKEDDQIEQPINEISDKVKENTIDQTLPDIPTDNKVNNSERAYDEADSQDDTEDSEQVMETNRAQGSNLDKDRVDD